MFSKHIAPIGPAPRPSAIVDPKSRPHGGPSESGHAASVPAGRATLVRSFRLLTPSLSRAACGGLPANRRCEVRRALRLGCRVRRIENLRLVGDRAVDVSPQGLLLLSDERLAEGASVDVSFMTTELPLWFDTRATVTRVIEGRRPGDLGRALGLRFDSLSSVSRLILRGHLRKVPPTLPQREVPLDLAGRRDPNYAAVVQAIAEGREPFLDARH